MALTEQEIEELQKEVILLRMRNERMQIDMKKYQDIIRDILIGEIKTELADDETTEVAEESPNSPEVENGKTELGHSENPA